MTPLPVDGKHQRWVLPGISWPVTISFGGCVFRIVSQTIRSSRRREYASGHLTLNACRQSGFRSLRDTPSAKTCYPMTRCHHNQSGSTSCRSGKLCGGAMGNLS